MFLFEFCVFSVLTSLITGDNAQLQKCKRRADLYDCSYREFTTVPQDIPDSIHHLDLSYNRIVIVKNRSFKFLNKLLSLRLDNNDIQEIQRDAFLGLTNLVQLTLESNALCGVLNGSFNPLISLLDLSIQNNRFRGTQMTHLAQTISNLSSIKILSIDMTDGFQFPREFDYLTKLNKLYLYGIKGIGKYTKSTFKHLDKTPVTYLHIYGVFSIEKETLFPLSKLTDLMIDIGEDVPTNPVDEIFKSFNVFKGRNMSSIKVSGNRFNNAFTLGRIHLKYVEDICLHTFILHSMYIKYINPMAFQLFSMKSNCLEYLALTNNIVYDEYGATIWVSIRNFKRLRVFTYTTFGDKLRGKRSNRFSAVKNITGVLPKTLEEMYLDHSMDITPFPNFVVINGYNVRVVSARNNYIRGCRGYVLGLENLRYLDISGWTCKQLSENVLSGFPNLQTFIARSAYFGIGFKNNPKISSLFRNNKRLQNVDLSNNSINAIPDYLFQHSFQTLRQVNLSLNKIITLPKFYSNVKVKKVIDLSYNSLSSFTDKEMKMITKMEPIVFYLRGNPLQCSCTTLNFMKWMTRPGNVADLPLIKCILENGSRKAMSEILSDFHAFEIKCTSRFWLIFSVILSSLFLLCVVFTIIYFRYKFAIEYLLLKWKMWWNGYKPVQADYMYDAFVSYSHHDISWVKVFHDNLDDLGFRLCLDAKDFIVGKGIAENVMNAIDSSRKVIFIITWNFLQSDWGSFEMEITRMHAFQEGREEMVIIVIKDNIKPEEMPRILKRMWYKVTCIQWPEDDNNIPFHTKEIFYEKMKQALMGNTADGNIRARNVCV